MLATGALLASFVPVAQAATLAVDDDGADCPGVRGDEFHDRAFWIGKLMYRIKSARIKTLAAQV